METALWIIAICAVIHVILEMSRLDLLKRSTKEKEETNKRMMELSNEFNEIMKEDDKEEA